MADFEVKTDLQDLDRTIAEIEQAKKLILKVGVDETMQYDNGTKVVDVAQYLEYGWTQTVSWKQRTWLLANSGVDVKRGTLHLPPRPTFGFTYQTCKGKWERSGSKLFSKFIESPISVALRAYEILGLMAVNDIKNTIQTNGKGSFPERSPLTLLLYGQNLEKHQPKGNSEKLKKRNISKKNTSDTKKALVRGTDGQPKFLNSITYEITDNAEDQANG